MCGLIYGAMVAMAALPVGQYDLGGGVTLRVHRLLVPSDWALSAYTKAQTDCAMAGGMKLRALVRERNADWVACAVYLGDGAVYAPTAGDALVFVYRDAGGERRYVSTDILAAADPTERVTWTAWKAQVRFRSSDTPTTPKGGYGFVAAFKPGSLPRDAKGRLVMPDAVERR